jgi:hypothetical protein
MSLNNYKEPWDYFVIIDADTLLPINFIEGNLPTFYGTIQNVGFVQASITAYNMPTIFNRVIRDRINCQDDFINAYKVFAFKRSIFRS